MLSERPRSVGFATGLRRSTRRITTMPNNECPKKEKITADAKKALADLKKVTDAQPELEPQLKSVKDSLTEIADDPHRPD
jgi:metal-sulfur cluster biosynthetic enzyme